MNTMQWIGVVGLAAIAAAASAAGAARWRYGRHAAALLARLDKLERARQLAGEHTAQARRQIEQLQKEVAAQHKARAEARMARKRESMPDAGDRTVRIEAPADSGPPPSLPAHGFADTLPMTSDPLALARR